MALLTSVIIPSRGGADRLPRLLGMLAAQDSAVEVVVVLDGDIDGSSQAVDGWRDRLDLTVIEFGENRGRAAALNAGFEAARGDVLIRCDDDLAPLSDFASRHAAHHSDSPIGVVGLVRNQFPDTAYARAYGRHWDRLQRDHAYASAPDSTWQHWAANCSVSRETWERIGPYDEAYRGYGWEDIDWGYRLHQAGVPVIIDPALETDHHLAAVTTATRVRRAYHAGSAKRRFEAKFDTMPTRGPDSAWARAVERAAHHLTEASSTAWAERLDSGVDRLPRPLARKAIAFLVESASRAGYLHPDESEIRF